MQNLDILNPVFLRDIDETGWKRLSGVLANTRICQLVPDLEVLTTSVSFFFFGNLMASGNTVFFLGMLCIFSVCELMLSIL